MQGNPKPSPGVPALSRSAPLEDPEDLPSQPRPWHPPWLPLSWPLPCLPSLLPSLTWQHLSLPCQPCLH